jgi:hypothetical protein
VLKNDKISFGMLNYSVNFPTQRERNKKPLSLVQQIQSLEPSEEIERRRFVKKDKGVSKNDGEGDHR